MTAVATRSPIEALLANIKLANNGYLVLEYMRANDRQFAIESAKNGVVTITNGVVHMPKAKPEFLKTPVSQKAFRLVPDGPDYEGAILSRQAAQGFYD